MVTRNQRCCKVHQLFSYDDYGWKQAVVDAMILQTYLKLRERAVQENATYDSVMKLGIANSLLKRLPLFSKLVTNNPQGHIKTEEQVQRLQSENNKLKAEIESTKTSKSQCSRCGRENCQRGNKYLGIGKRCRKCQK